MSKELQFGTMFDVVGRLDYGDTPAPYHHELFNLTELRKATVDEDWEEIINVVQNEIEQLYHSKYSKQLEDKLSVYDGLLGYGLTPFITDNNFLLWWNFIFEDDYYKNVKPDDLKNIVNEVLKEMNKEIENKILLQYKNKKWDLNGDIENVELVNITTSVYIKFRGKLRVGK